MRVLQQLRELDAKRESSYLGESTDYLRAINRELLGVLPLLLDVADAAAEVDEFDVRNEQFSKLQAALVRLQEHDHQQTDLGGDRAGTRSRRSGGGRTVIEYRAVETDQRVRGMDPDLLTRFRMRADRRARKLNAQRFANFHRWEVCDWLDGRWAVVAMQNVAADVALAKSRQRERREAQ